MRRFPVTGPVLVMILLAGCSTEPPSAPNAAVLSAQDVHPTAVLASHQAASPAVPIRGTCELVLQSVQSVSPGVIRQIDVGPCRIAHLGRSTMVSDKVINLMAGTQTTVIAITAANGDLLHASGGGTNTMVAPGQVSFRVEMTITSGTGRFSGASGQIVAEGLADLANSTAQLTMTGAIKY